MKTFIDCFINYEGNRFCEHQATIIRPLKRARIEACLPWNHMYKGRVHAVYTDQKHWFNFLAFLRKCLDPGVPKNGFRVGEDFSYKETVEYFCDPGFKLTEGTRFRSCQKNSKWNGTLPTCKGLLNHSEPYANHCDMNKFFHNNDNNYDNDNMIFLCWQNNIFKSNNLHKIGMTIITFQLTSSRT